MRLYLDASAIVKLVQREPESDALRRFLRRHGGDERVTSALARTEVVRAVAGGGADAIAHARRQLGRLYQITVDREVLDDAAVIAPRTVLRTLEAIHLTSARWLGADLRALITYDTRMAAAAEDLGIPTAAPT